MSQLVDIQVSHCILGISMVSCLEEGSPKGSSFYPYPSGRAISVKISYVMTEVKFLSSCSQNSQTIPSCGVINMSRADIAGISCHIYILHDRQFSLKRLRISIGITVY